MLQHAVTARSRQKAPQEGTTSRPGYPLLGRLRSSDLGSLRRNSDIVKPLMQGIGSLLPLLDLILVGWLWVEGDGREERLIPLVKDVQNARNGGDGINHAEEEMAANVAVTRVEEKNKEVLLSRRFHP